MIKRRLNRQTKCINITTILGVVVMFLFLFSSCGGGDKEVVAVAYNPEETYTMRTTDFTSLVSDSGITRFRISSAEMLVFDKAAEPYTYFPKGLYVEQFDSLFVTEASLKADTVYNWMNKKLWKAIGNVEVQNLEGVRFETDYLYWDEEKQRVYSDAFMRIERPDRIITGIGFESNQDMSVYRIYHPQGSFPVNQESRTDTTTQVTRDPETVASPMPSVNHQRPQRRTPPSSSAIPADTLQMENNQTPELQD